MMRSLFAGISGLRAHQTMMDVTGNNIANVNTTGYKSSQVIFADALSQTLRPATAGITTNFGQGATQLTGRNTDMLIQGDGFFVVDAAGQQAYSRAGAFSFDAAGRLCTQDGGLVQGWMATAGVV